MKAKKVSKRQKIARLSEIARPFYGRFAKLTLSVLLAQSIFIIIPYLTGRWLDALIHHDTARAAWSIAWMAVAMFAVKLAEWLISWCYINLISDDLQAHISDVTLTKVLTFSVGQIANQNSGFKQDTLKKGEAAISELLNVLFMEVIPSMLRVIITVGIMFTASWQVGCAAIVTICLYVYSSIRANNKVLPRIKASSKVETKIGTEYWELIKHLRLVMVSGQEEKAVREFDEKYQGFNKESKSLWSLYIYLVTVFREPFSVLGQVAIYGICSYKALNGTMTPGNVMVVTGWIVTTFGALGGIGAMQRRLARNFVTASKYFDLIEIEPAVRVVQNPIKPAAYVGRIEFKDVSFSYPEYDIGSDGDDEPAAEKAEQSAALTNISFVIEPGELCALVGSSGSGKSTAVNLILRGYDPVQGKVLIDGNDLSLMDHRHWRKAVGVVEQDPKLWDKTLAENITYSLNGEAERVTEADLEALAHKTRISEFYPRLGTARFKTVIGENGIQLSGGQRQRVAIARALIKDPRLLILDEATNALDPMNERLVHEAIREAMKGRTGIIIAHRLSTIRHADKIIVFEKGRIAGIGTHRELMEGCTAYQELVACETGAYA